MEIMDIEELGIANFRSFDPEGIVIRKIGTINIFIGKNNSGKSNILRFIKIFSDNYDSPGNYPHNIENQFRRNSQLPILTISIKAHKLFTSYPPLKNHYDDEDVLSFKINIKTKVIEESSLSNLDHKDLLHIHKGITGGPKHELLIFTQITQCLNS